MGAAGRFRDGIPVQRAKRPVATAPVLAFQLVTSAPQKLRLSSIIRFPLSLTSNPLNSSPLRRHGQATTSLACRDSVRVQMPCASWVHRLQVNTYLVTGLHFARTLSRQSSYTVRQRASARLYTNPQLVGVSLRLSASIDCGGGGDSAKSFTETSDHLGMITSECRSVLATVQPLSWWRT